MIDKRRWGRPIPSPPQLHVRERSRDKLDPLLEVMHSVFPSEDEYVSAFGDCPWCGCRGDLHVVAHYGEGSEFTVTRIMCEKCSTSKHTHRVTCYQRHGVSEVEYSVASA